MLRIPKRAHQASCAFLLVIAIAVSALAAWTYGRGRNRYQLVYTQSVRQRDISDSARNAISALQDAVLQTEGYALTGETIYQEGYAKDLREWQDESGTLQLVSRRDGTATLIHDFLGNANRIVEELTDIHSLYDKGSRDAAVDRIRKGSASVYMGEARATVAEIQQLDGYGADEKDQRFITDSLRLQRRLMAAVGCLCFLSVVAAILALIGTKRGSGVAGNLDPAERRSAATVG